MHCRHNAILLAAAFQRTLAAATTSSSCCLALSLPQQLQQLFPLSFPDSSWPVYKQKASNGRWDFLELLFFKKRFFFKFLSISCTLFDHIHPPTPSRSTFTPPTHTTLCSVFHFKILQFQFVMLRCETCLGAWSNY